MTIQIANAWANKPRIYVENIRDLDPAYYLSTEAVLTSLQSVCQPTDITCRYSDEAELQAFRRADILVTGRFNTECIAQEGSNLKLIQCTSAGVEKYYPFDWLPAQTILTNASGVHAAKAAEFGLMAALMLQNYVPAVMTRQRDHIWSRKLCGTASGTRVLLYGVGAIGSAIAERLKSSGFCVTGVRRSGTLDPSVEKMILPNQLYNELPYTDILIISCALTPETRRSIGAKEFAALPEGAGILNISRGGVIDQTALVQSLENEHISGAILDVFDQEPLPFDSPLWDVPNLMVFPHVSADSPNGYIARCLAVLSDNLARIKIDQPLRNVVDPMLGY